MTYQARVRSFRQLAEKGVRVPSVGAELAHKVVCAAHASHRAAGRGTHACAPGGLARSRRAGPSCKGMCLQPGRT